MAVVEEHESSTTTTTTTTTTTLTSEEQDGESIVKEFITTEKEAKVVEWPPKDDGKISNCESGQYAVKYSAKAYDTFCEQNEAPVNSKYSEVFKPGKINADDRWKPTESSTITTTFYGRPKRVMRNVEDILQNNGPATHASYHIPPGTTRTKKAQQIYNKHLETMDSSSS